MCASLYLYISVHTLLMSTDLLFYYLVLWSGFDIDKHNKKSDGDRRRQS